MLTQNQSKTLIVSNILLLTIVIALLFSNMIQKGNDVQSFKEINAERINIKNEDGTTVIAIANKQRVGAPRMGGKEYPVSMIERETLAGMIFYNEAGDEMGGLVFNSFELPDGRKAGLGHLSFDRLNDNQVINLEHKENIKGNVTSGISFYDRPGNGNFKKSLDIMEVIKGNPSEDEKKEAYAQWNQLLKSEGGLGKKRVFLGSHNEEPQLLLKDKHGKDRVKIFVDSLDIARIHFLDADGNVINELSGI